MRSAVALVPLALLLLVLPGVAQIPTELAGHPLGSFPWFHYVQSINVDRGVTCGLDPSRVPVVLGQTFDAYVVAARTVAQYNANSALLDVRPGGPTTMTVVPAGLVTNSFLLAGPNTLNAINAFTLNPNAGSVLGVGYDIVLDLDQDGVLGAGDLIDGYGDVAGFYMCHDTTLPGPYPVSTAWYIGAPPPLLWNSKKIYFPGGPLVGQYPLVVISHGFLHDYTWYDHIGQHLASYGYIVMSHQSNVGNGDALGTETASSSLIDNTEQFFASLGTIGSGVLQGHVDNSRIVWIGHSTGGEAVTRAATRLRNDNLPTNHFDIDDIALLVGLAPVAWLGSDKVNPADTPYHTFLGAADLDTSGSPVQSYAQTLSIFERAYGPRSVTYIHGCGHEWLHTAPFPNGPFATGPNLIGEAASHKVLLGYLLPVVEHHVRGNPAARDYLERMYADFHPIGIPGNVVVSNEYRDPRSAKNLVLDDFQDHPELGISTQSTAVITNASDSAEVRMGDVDGSFDWNPAQPSNGMTRASDQVLDDPRCLVLDWDGSQVFYWEVALPVAERDLRDDGYLSFRVCQGTRHPRTTGLSAPLSFNATLVDGNGRSSNIEFGVYGQIPQPYARTGFGTGAGWQNEFSVVRIRLADFAANGTPINLSNIHAVRFRFGVSCSTPVGRVGIDDVEITNPNAMAGAVSIGLPFGAPTLVDPASATSVVALVRGRGESVLPGSVLLHWRVGGGAWGTVSPVSQAGDLYTMELPPVTCHASIDWYLTADGAQSGAHRFPVAAPATWMTTPAPSALCPWAAGTYPTELLTVNGTTGGASRIVDVTPGGPITAALAQPGTLTAGTEHALFLRVGIPTAADAWHLNGIGTFCFPICWPACAPQTALLAASPGWIWHPSALSNVHSLTPWTDTFANPGVPFEVTIQGGFMDAGNVVRITNAVVIRHQ